MPRRHAPFEDLFLHGGLVLALAAGFGAAVLLAAERGVGLDLGAWWVVLVQVHGHALVYGWLGLFIMGVSLYFLPRFAGAPLRWPGGARLVAALFGGGIALHGAGQLLLFADRVGGDLLLVLGSAAELLGVGLYVGLLSVVLRGADPSRRPVRALRICLAGALVGWLASVGVTSWGSLAATRQAGLLLPGWNRLGLDLFVGLVLLPIAFAFSVRTFPLYLRLPAVRWSVDALVAVYLAGFVAEIAATGAALADASGGILDAVGHGGRAVKGLAILAFVWRLDLLTRRRPAWIVEREGTPPEEPRRHPTPRPQLPDYGEFGHFEWHLYTAYGFLVIGGLLELHGGLGALSQQWAPVADDLRRHVYLAGFGTLLLLGMAPRMLPGFWGLRRPASTRLVDLSFALGAAAATLRLVPFLVPGQPGVDAARVAFGLSGPLGWLAVASLAGNLWWTTWRRRTSATASPAASATPR